MDEIQMIRGFFLSMWTVAVRSLQSCSLNLLPSRVTCGESSQRVDVPRSMGILDGGFLVSFHLERIV